MQLPDQTGMSFIVFADACKLGQRPHAGITVQHFPIVCCRAGGEL